MLGLQSSDALPDLVEPLVRSRAGQPVVELRQGGLEAGGETLDDAALLLGPLLGVAVQAHFVGIGRDHLVPVHGLVRLRLERHGGIGIEPAVAFAADHQIAVAVVAQPRHTGVGGDTAVHHRPGRRPAPPVLRASRPASGVRGRCRRRPSSGARSRWHRASGPGSAAGSRCASPSSARVAPAAGRSPRPRSRCWSGRRASPSAAGRTAPSRGRTDAPRSPRDASPARPRRGRAASRRRSRSRHRATPRDRCAPAASGASRAPRRARPNARRGRRWPRCAGRR